jgi:transcription antitermination factor NusG
MIDQDMPNGEGLLPGDRVRVTSGTFVGLEGTVLSEKEAEKFLEKNGGEEGPLKNRPRGSAYVALPLFGRKMPIFLERFQIERIGR